MLELWFLTVQLHGLQRLSPLYPLVILGTTFVVFAKEVRWRIERRAFLWIAANLGILAYVLLIDLYASRELATPNNIVRVSTPFVIAIIMAFSVRSISNVAKLSVVYLIVVLLGAGSMYYQVVFGAVSWFADSSERAGVTRFASLLGSLTIFGTAAPFAYLCLARYVRSAAWFAVGALVLIVAAMLSLQKAALLGMMIAGPFSLALISRRALLVTAAVTLVAIGTVSALIPPEYQQYVDATVQYFFRPSVESDDFSISESIAQRVLALPAEVIDSVGWRAMITGVGLRGAGGVFGFDNLPMAHNGIVDYLAVGGLPFATYGLCIVLWLMRFVVRVPLAVRRNVLKREDAYFLCGMAVLYVANLPMSSGLQFQPNTSWVFGMLIAFDMALRNALRNQDSRTTAHASSSTFQVSY